MSKKKKVHHNDDKMTPPINLILPDNMPQEDMQNLIVNSLLAYDEAKKEREKVYEEQELIERRQAVGYKDFSNRRFVPRLFFTFINKVWVLLKILFMSKQKIKGDYSTIGLMKFAVSILFSAAKWILWGIAFILFLSYPFSLILPKAPDIALSIYPAYISFGVLALLFAQLFRVASIEIEKMKDHNYVVDIFAAVAAVVAIIISFVIR